MSLSQQSVLCGPAFRQGVCAVGKEQTDRGSRSVLQGGSPGICPEAALLPQGKEEESGQVQGREEWVLWKINPLVRGWMATQPGGFLLLQKGR